MIIEDDADLREILKFSLERAGYKTYEAESAENGLEMMNDRIRLILLDVMLPGMSGYELAGVLREKGCKIPIIFLTARSSEEDLLSGFASGGDDYVAKPFSTAELLARIGAVLKRSASSCTGLVHCGLLSVDLDAEKVFLEGNEVLFSRKDYEILAFLIRNQGTFSLAARSSRRFGWMRHLSLTGPWMSTSRISDRNWPTTKACWSAA